MLEKGERKDQPITFGSTYRMQTKFLFEEAGKFILQIVISTFRKCRYFEWVIEHVTFSEIFPFPLKLKILFRRLLFYLNRLYFDFKVEFLYIVGIFVHWIKSWCRRKGENT